MTLSTLKATTTTGELATCSSSITTEGNMMKETEKKVDEDTEDDDDDVVFLEHIRPIIPLGYKRVPRDPLSITPADIERAKKNGIVTPSLARTAASACPGAIVFRSSSSSIIVPRNPPATGSVMQRKILIRHTPKFQKPIQKTQNAAKIKKSDQPRPQKPILLKEVRVLLERLEDKVDSINKGKNIVKSPAVANKGESTMLGNKEEAKKQSAIVIFTEDFVFPAVQSDFVKKVPNILSRREKQQNSKAQPKNMSKGATQKSKESQMNFNPKAVIGNPNKNLEVATVCSKVPSVQIITSDEPILIKTVTDESAILAKEGESVVNKDESVLLFNEVESEILANKDESAISFNEAESEILANKDECAIVVNKDESAISFNEAESENLVNEVESTMSVNKDESFIVMDKDKSATVVDKEESTMLGNQEEALVVINKEKSAIVIDKPPPTIKLAIVKKVPNILSRRKQPQRSSKKVSTGATQKSKTKSQMNVNPKAVIGQCSNPIYLNKTTSEQLTDKSVIVTSPVSKIDPAVVCSKVPSVQVEPIVETVTDEAVILANEEESTIVVNKDESALLFNELTSEILSNQIESTSFVNNEESEIFFNDAKSALEVEESATVANKEEIVGNKEKSAIIVNEEESAAVVNNEESEIFFNDAKSALEVEESATVANKEEIVVNKEKSAIIVNEEESAAVINKEESTAVLNKEESTASIIVNADESELPATQPAVVRLSACRQKQLKKEKKKAKQMAKDARLKAKADAKKAAKDAKKRKKAEALQAAKDRKKMEKAEAKDAKIRAKTEARQKAKDARKNFKSLNPNCKVPSLQEFEKLIVESEKVMTTSLVTSKNLDAAAICSKALSIQQQDIAPFQLVLENVTDESGVVDKLEPAIVSNKDKSAIVANKEESAVKETSALRDQCSVNNLNLVLDTPEFTKLLEEPLHQSSVDNFSLVLDTAEFTKLMEEPLHQSGVNNLNLVLDTPEFTKLMEEPLLESSFNNLVLDTPDFTKFMEELRLTASPDDPLLIQDEVKDQSEQSLKSGPLLDSHSAPSVPEVVEKVQNENVLSNEDEKGPGSQNREEVDVSDTDSNGMGSSVIITTIWRLYKCRLCDDSDFFDNQIQFVDHLDEYHGVKVKSFRAQEKMENEKEDPAAGDVDRFYKDFAPIFRQQDPESSDQWDESEWEDDSFGSDGSDDEGTKKKNKSKLDPKDPDYVPDKVIVKKKNVGRPEKNKCRIERLTMPKKLPVNSQVTVMEVQSELKVESKGESKGTLLDHHRVKNRMVKRDYICHLCRSSKQLFTSIVQLREHLRANHMLTHNYMKRMLRRINTDGHIYLYSPPKQLDSDILILKKPHVCNICDYRFQNKSLIERHRQVYHNFDTTWNCTSCNKHFNRAEDFERHVKFIPIHRGVVDASTLPCTQAELDAPFGCSKCKKSFANMNCVRYHIGTHEVYLHEKIVFRCNMCGEIKNDPDKLHDHIVVMHIKDAAPNLFPKYNPPKYRPVPTNLSQVSNYNPVRPQASSLLALSNLNPLQHHNEPQSMEVLQTPQELQVSPTPTIAANPAPSLPIGSPEPASVKKTNKRLVKPKVHDEDIICPNCKVKIGSTDQFRMHFIICPGKPKA